MRTSHATTEAVGLARLGAVLASESRSHIICALMDGTAHTVGELARHLRLAPSSLSEHVAVLLDAGLVRIEAQGRHRYVRIADPSTATLIEQLGVIASTMPPVGLVPAPSVPSSLRHARSCYRHLAGRLGVTVLDALCATDALLDDGDRLILGPRSHDVFTALGVNVDGLGINTPSRAIARLCLDWSERRHHLAGPLGDALLGSLLERRWINRSAPPRALTLSTHGRRELTAILRTELP